MVCRIHGLHKVGKALVTRTYFLGGREGVQSMTFKSTILKTLIVIAYLPLLGFAKENVKVKLVFETNSGDVTEGFNSVKSKSCTYRIAKDYPTIIEFHPEHNTEEFLTKPNFDALRIIMDDVKSVHFKRLLVQKNRPVLCFWNCLPNYQKPRYEVRYGKNFVIESIAVYSTYNGKESSLIDRCEF